MDSFGVRHTKGYGGYVHLRTEIIYALALLGRESHVFERKWIEDNKPYVIKFNAPLEYFTYYSFYGDIESFKDDYIDKIELKKWLVKTALLVVWECYHYDQCPDEIMAYMLKAAYRKDPYHRLYYLLVLVMLTTGLRSAEINQLTRSQIDLTRQVINVTNGTKTTENGVYIPKQVVKEFERYLSYPFWLKWSRAGNQEVFFHNQTKFVRDRLRLILKEISKEAGLKVNVHPHMLRHTCAHLMNQGGIDPVIIQRQLRHKHLFTTLRYLSPDKDKIEAQEKLVEIMGIE
jgi:integrase